MDPVAARASFARASAKLGAERATTLLHTEPERFGALKTVKRPRALGLVITHDDVGARSAAPSAAFRGRELAEAEHALGAVVREHERGTVASPEPTGTRTETSAEVARAAAANVVSRMTERTRRLQHEVKHGPSLGLLERSIGRVVDHMLPREIAQLRRVLTSPQAAIAFRAREAVKDLVLGRAEAER